MRHFPNDTLKKKGYDYKTAATAHLLVTQMLTEILLRHERSYMSRWAPRARDSEAAANLERIYNCVTNQDLKVLWEAEQGPRDHIGLADYARLYDLDEEKLHGAAREILGQVHRRVDDNPLFEDCPRDRDESEACRTCDHLETRQPTWYQIHEPTRCSAYTRRQRRAREEIDGRLSYLELPNYHWLGNYGRNGEGKYVNALSYPIEGDGWSTEVLKEGDGWSTEVLKEGEPIKPSISCVATTPASTAWLEAIWLNSSIPQYTMWAQGTEQSPAFKEQARAVLAFPAEALEELGDTWLAH